MSPSTGEGDSVFWRVVASTRMASPAWRRTAARCCLRRKPDMPGAASVTIEADDGYASSGADRAAVQCQRRGAAGDQHRRHTGPLRAGESRVLQAFGDFADERGVALTGNYLQWSIQNWQPEGGYRAVTEVDAVLQGRGCGLGLRQGSRGGIQGVRSFEIDGPSEDTLRLALGGLDVYPGSVSLVTPQADGTGAGTRQIRLTEVYGGLSLEDSYLHLLSRGRWTRGLGRTGRADHRTGRRHHQGLCDPQVGQVELTVHVVAPRLLTAAEPAVEVERRWCGAAIRRWSPGGDRRRLLRCAAFWSA